MSSRNSNNSTTNINKVPSVNRIHDIDDMGDRSVLSRRELDRRNIIYPGMSDLRVLNVYRDLRTKLQNSSKNENFICLVSSLDSESESSNLAVNLAAVIAFDPARTTLLIDCDMGTTLVDTLVPSKSPVGLIDFLERKQSDLQNIIYSSGIPRIRVIPSGRKSDTAAEYFASSSMLNLFTHVKKRYADRTIIINAPCMKLSSEINILANICDLALFEVPYGRVTVEGIRAGIDMVGPEKLAGVVYRQ